MIYTAIHTCSVFCKKELLFIYVTDIIGILTAYINIFVKMLLKREVRGIIKEQNVWINVAGILVFFVLFLCCYSKLRKRNFIILSY